MNITDIIRQRRSIRKYKEKMPADKDIEKILEAGRWAPSGLNNQPWKFLIIKEKDLKDGVAKFTKYGYIINSAPVLICVFLDNSLTYNRNKDLMSAGACIQNICLQACYLGLGTCWLGEILNQNEKVHQYLKAEKDLELVAVLALGYPQKSFTDGSRKALKSFLVKIKR